MIEQPELHESGPESALSTPLTAESPVGFGLKVRLSASNLVLYLALQAVIATILPMQIDQLDPVHKVTTLSLALGFGSIFGMLANPLAGALSDRTVSRFGRRGFWMMLGALLGAGSLVLLLFASSIIMLLLGVVCFEIAANFMMAALNAIIPDQVPEKQYGTISGLYSLFSILGAILASVMVGLLTKTVLVSYITLALLLLVIFLPLSLSWREPVVSRETLEPFELGTFLKSFWINPLRYPDFGWAWISRFLVVLGYSTAGDYLFYYLEDVLKFQKLFPGRTVAQGQALLSLISFVAIALATILGGIIADRFQRYKLLVLISSLVIAAALLIYGFLPIWGLVIFAGLLMGIGTGAYRAIDLALIMQVLPNAKNRGKDMGIFYIANTLSQSLTPIIGGLAFSVLHSYAPLYVIGAVAALLGAGLVWPIRSVR